MWYDILYYIIFSTGIGNYREYFLCILHLSSVIQPSSLFNLRMLECLRGLEGYSIKNNYVDMVRVKVSYDFPVVWWLTTTDVRCKMCRLHRCVSWGYFVLSHNLNYLFFKASTITTCIFVCTMYYVMYHDYMILYIFLVYKQRCIKGIPVHQYTTYKIVSK